MVTCDQIAAVILEHASGKGFAHSSETVVAVTTPTPTTSGEHFLTSVFGCVERFPNAQRSRTVGCEGRDGEILMSALQEAHCRGMRRE